MDRPKKIRLDENVFAVMSTDFDGKVDASGITEKGTRGWCFVLPKEFVVHDERIEMRTDERVALA